MPKIEVYTKSWCGYCRMAKDLLDAQGLDYTEIDLTDDPGKEKEVIDRSGQMTVPQIFIDGESIGGYQELREAEAAGRLDGLGNDKTERKKEPKMDSTPRKMVVMGSGPAGLTAALYAARANLEPLVVEGAEAGGQLTLTTDVENFPGFPKGILGPDLMTAMREQAARFGAELIRGNISSADLSNRPFHLEIEGRTILAQTVIIASGASAKLLGLEAEKKLIGHGLSTCATCDGFFFRDKRLLVVGGGDSAMEEGIFLTKFASQVTIVHRRDQLRASKVMQDRARANEKIDFLWNKTIEDISDPAQGKVLSAILKDTQSGKTTEVPCDGIFVAIGHTPNTAIFKGQLEMDETGYLITRNGTATNVEGVFAAGDVQDHVYRQAITAAGTGCMAAIDAERFLES